MFNLLNTTYSFCKIVYLQINKLYNSKVLYFLPSLAKAGVKHAKSNKVKTKTLIILNKKKAFLCLYFECSDLNLNIGHKCQKGEKDYLRHFKIYDSRLQLKGEK